MKYFITFLCFVFLFTQCKTDEETEKPVVQPGSYYFPPASGEWETKSAASLSWNINALQQLDSFHAANNSRAFIILHKGKIVVERYMGKNLARTTDFDQNSKWYWASAGKSLTAVLVGLAQQKGLLSIEDKTSDYLGKGWTNAPPEKEDLILIKNQLSMTCGMDYRNSDIACTLDSCLQYKEDAGTEWYYYNATYTLLEDVVANASGIHYNAFTDNEIENKIGMDGNWLKSGYNNVYWSTARDAARFGSFILKKGNWNGEQIISDQEYFNAMVNSSQQPNPSYGYLWWLNGKDQTVFPGSSVPLSVSLTPDAPADLFAAMGKNGQFIDVVPSLDLVVVRMGEAPDNSLVPVTFHNEMWEILMQAIQY